MAEEEEVNPMLALLQAPDAVLHRSAERAEELMNEDVKEGTITSTGRELQVIGCPSDRLAEIEAWKAKSPSIPLRTRDYHNHHFCSDKWDMIKPRNDDIIISTAYKSGTTWMQTIVANILFKGKIPGWESEDFGGILEMSPWLDMRMPPAAAITDIVEGMKHRRFLKSHLPLDGIPFNAKAKYIVCVRDLRDVAYSWYNHWAKATVGFDFMNKIAGRIGPPIPPCEETAKDIFMGMITEKETWMWSYWHHLATWAAYKDLDNILFVHYADMKKDPVAIVNKIASFIEVPLSPEEVNVVVNQTTFDYMKENHVKVMGKGFQNFFETGDGVPGGQNFLFKGTNGRWKDDLSEEDVKEYEAYGKTRVSESTFNFLVNGGEP